MHVNIGQVPRKCQTVGTINGLLLLAFKIKRNHVFVFILSGICLIAFTKLFYTFFFFFIFVKLPKFYTEQKLNHHLLFPTMLPQLRGCPGTVRDRPRQTARRTARGFKKREVQFRG